jgi:hypothetical protein
MVKSLSRLIDLMSRIPPAGGEFAQFHLRVLAMNRISSKIRAPLMDRLLEWNRTRHQLLLETGVSDRQLVRVAIDEAADYMRRVEELAHVLGVQVDLDEDYLLLLSLISLTGDLIAQWKYTVNVIFCKHYKLESPEPKSWYLGDRLLPRTLRVHFNVLRSERRRLTNRSQTHVYTLFQGFKKGLVPARLEQVAQSLKDHSDALSRARVTPPEIIERSSNILKKLINPIDLGRASAKNSRHSRKATGEFSYGHGGNIGYACQVLRHRGAGTVRPHELLAFSSSDIDPHEIRATCFSNEEVFEVLKELKYGDFKWGFHATPNCILEPMKVRIITKPRVANYHCMRHIQKGVWRMIKNHPTGFFALIGEPLAKEHLGPILRSWDTGKKFVSGDYKAATDNLNADFTRPIVDYVLSKTLNADAYFASRSLYEATIHYRSSALPNDERYSPDDPAAPELPERMLRAVGVPDEVCQQNGQLMGNPFSFPILCVANYIAYHYSLEEYYGKELSVSYVRENHPVLINGDDILFCSTKGHYEIWKKVVKAVGLEPSVGKNLFSEEILQINSELYQVSSLFGEEKSSVVHCRKIPYVNFGLLTFRKKQDCSKDLTVSRVGLQAFDVTDVSDPLWFRVKNCLKIRETLLEGHDEFTINRIFDVWKSHMKPCQDRFKKLPWDELWDTHTPEREYSLSFYLKRMFSNMNGELMKLGGQASNLSLLEPRYEPDKQIRRVRREERRSKASNLCEACGLTSCVCKVLNGPPLNRWEVSETTCVVRENEGSVKGCLMQDDVENVLLEDWATTTTIC